MCELDRALELCIWQGTEIISQLDRERVVGAQ